MKNIVDDIIEYIKNWKKMKSYDNFLSCEQITEFVGDIQEQISLMDFLLPRETTIIGYSGLSNDVETWKIAKNVSDMLGDKAVYITDLPAGSLLTGENQDALETAINNYITYDKVATSMILSGCDSDWNRIGPNCGYGDYLSLDDFISSKLMGECTGVSNNVIIFAPEELNPNKVFCATELESIFANDTFKYINGIPKEELSALYYSGEAGRNSVYQIISRTSREVVGTTYESYASQFAKSDSRVEKEELLTKICILSQGQIRYFFQLIVDEHGFVDYTYIRKI